MLICKNIRSQHGKDEQKYLLQIIVNVNTFSTKEIIFRGMFIVMFHAEIFLSLTLRKNGRSLQAHRQTFSETSLILTTYFCTKSIKSNAIGVGNFNVQRNRQAS